MSRGYTISARCTDCRQWFYYVRTNPHGRKRTTCDDCATKHKQSLVQKRVQRFRARQKEQQKPASKRRRAEKPRPVPVGSREDTERATPEHKPGGLFADLPEPGRTTKRKAVGLP